MIDPPWKCGFRSGWHQSVGEVNTLSWDQQFEEAKKVMRKLVKDTLELLKNRGIIIPEFDVNYVVSDPDKILLRVNGEVEVKRDIKLARLATKPHDVSIIEEEA